MGTNKNVKFLSEADQKKWLTQRNWIQDGQMWRDPETSIRYVFVAALKKAIDDCRVPADYELKPD